MRDDREGLNADIKADANPWSSRNIRTSRARRFIGAMN